MTITETVMKKAVEKYTEHLEEEPEELQGYAVVGRQEDGNRIKCRVEVTYGNEWAAYTRIADFIFLGGGAKVRFNSVPSKTRLHVHADKVFTGMHFVYDGVEYTAEIQVFTEGNTLAGKRVGSEDTCLRWVANKEMVEVTCYYVHDEGSYIGGILIADVRSTEIIAGRAGLNVDGLINGCKFGMYDALFEHGRMILGE